MIKKITIGIVILSVATGLYFLTKKPERTGYVQIQRLFNEFDYKKEMEKKLRHVEEVRKKELDSLELCLKILLKEVELNRKDPSKAVVFQAHRDDFMQKREKYQKEYEEAVGRYDEIVIKQLNQYVKEYGKQHDYHYIFGADGGGSLMYADTLNDLTDMVIVFANKKHKGL